MDGIQEWRWKMDDGVEGGVTKKHGQVAMKVPKGGRFSEKERVFTTVSHVCSFASRDGRIWIMMLEVMDIVE
jgi:hypothetical protein